METMDKNAGSAAIRAYRAIEHQIVTLTLAPGATMSETDLVERAGFGRTPVREAIQRLSWEGLMEVRPRAGLAVAPLHPGDWLRVLEVRRGIEPVLARSAARFATRETGRLMHDAAAAMEAAVAADDISAFLEADKTFDDVLGSACDNPFAVRAAGPLQSHSRRFWYRYCRATGLAESAEHHVAVINAIIDGDARRAEEEALRMIALLEVYARSVV